MAFNVINPRQTFYDSTGAVRAGGFLTFFVNTTSTVAAIFSDEALTVSQSNPYELDANGQVAADVKYSGLMTVKETNFDGSLPRTTDNVATIGEVDVSDTTIDSTNESAMVFAGPTIWKETALADLKWDDTNKRFSINVAASLEKLHLQDGNILVTPGTNAVKGTPTVLGTPLVDAANLNGVKGVFVLGNYAYLACGDDDSMQVIDVTDPANPARVGGIKNAVDMNGIFDVVCDGRYVYAACRTDNSLRVIDIKDPTNPTAVGFVKDNTNLAAIEKLYLSGQYLYVTCYSDNSLRVINISDPTTPVIYGAGLKDNTNLAGISDVHVVGEYAYVVCYTDNSIRIINISDPAVPVMAGGLQDNSNLDRATTIVVTGLHAYITTNLTLEIIDVSDPTTPVRVGGVGGGGVFDGIKGLAVAGDYAYATYDYDAGPGILVIDISDPTTPALVAELEDNSYSGSLGIMLVGKYLYVTTFGADKLSVIDISGIKAPAATIGSLGATILDVASDARIGNDLIVGGALNIRKINLQATETSLGAAKIATQAVIDAGTNDTDLLTALKLENKPAISASVGQGELKTTSGTVSTTASNELLTLPGGSYGFYLQIHSSTANVRGYCAQILTPEDGVASDGGDFAIATSATTYIVLGMWAGSATITATQRYIQASPPYNHGDGDIPLYVFAKVHASGTIISLYIAPEAPWHYNGPTDIRAHKVINGVSYRERKDLSGVASTYLEAKQNGTAALQQYIAAFTEAPTILEEITQEIKHLDMDLIPHPFGSVRPSETVVLLDPVSSLLQHVYEMQKHDEFDADSFIRDYYKIGNTAINRRGPPGVMPVSVEWK